VDRRRGSGDVSADQGAVIHGLLGPVRLLVSAKRQKVQAHLKNEGFTGRALARRSAATCAIRVRAVRDIKKNPLEQRSIWSWVCFPIVDNPRDKSHSCYWIEGATVEAIIR
jgi:hypothetical protein